LKTGSYESGGYNVGNQDSSMANRMNDTGNTYGSNMSSGPNLESKQPNLGSTDYSANKQAENYREGISANPYSASGGYSNMNTGGLEAEPTNKMDKELGNQGTYGDTMDQTKKYTSDYGKMGDAQPTGTHGYNTRSGNTGSGMANQMETRAESGVNNRTDQQDFGGAAAGGSSYNAPSPGRRRSSGPHSSNLLNKLDPRVRSSDYENKSKGDQRTN